MKLPWLSIAMLMAACGGSGGGEDPPDAGPDAAVELGTAHVKVQSFGRALPGIPVVFQSASGRVLDVVVSDAAGEATGAMEPDGMVTYQRYGQELPDLMTRVGVQLDDDLVLDDPSSVPSVASVGALDLSLPSTVEGADGYVIEVGCAQLTRRSFHDITPGAPVTIAIGEGCVTAGAVSVAAVASDGTHALAYTTALAVPLDPDGTTELALPAWRSDFDPVTITGDGFGPRLAGGWVTLHVQDGRGEIAFLDEQVTDPIAGGFTANARVPHGLPAELEVELDFGDGMWTGLRRTGAVTSPYAITADEVAPRIVAMTLDSTDVARPTARWTYAAGAPVISSATIFLVGGTSSWFVDRPGAIPSASFRFPELPDQLAASRPTARNVVGQVYVESARASGVTWSVRRGEGVI